MHKIKSTWEYLLAPPVWELGSLVCLGEKTEGLVGRAGDRGLGAGHAGTTRLPLPTALPLMNGYSSYEQHHSGKAAPLLGCGLWPPKASLGLGLVCLATEGGPDSPPCLGGRLCSGFGRSRALLSIGRVCMLSRDASCLLSCGHGPSTGDCPGMLGSAVPLAWGDLPAAREVWSKGRRKGFSVGSSHLLISAATRLSAGDVL